MLAAGAAGYLLKNAAADELVRAIHSVRLGQKYLSPEIAGLVVDTMFEKLSDAELPGARVLLSRERQVLQLIAEGHTSKAIARQLNIAAATIETH